MGVDRTLHKIVALDGSGGTAEYRYGDIYQLQDISGVQRLIIGPSGSHIDMLLDLSDLFEEPFRIIYVLVDPIGVKEDDTGRFEFDGEMTRAEMRAFFERFREFFECDARHHIWVTAKNGTVIYDQHNILYAYGPILDIEQILLSKGLTPGDVEFPYPHMHAFHQEMNPHLEALLKEYNWRWFPLDTRQDVYR